MRITGAATPPTSMSYRRPRRLGRAIILRRHRRRGQGLAGSGRELGRGGGAWGATLSPQHNLEFGRFDSGRFLTLRGRIPRSIGSFPEIQTQGFLVCEFLVCGLAVRGGRGVRGCRIKEGCKGAKGRSRGVGPSGAQGRSCEFTTRQQGKTSQGARGRRGEGGVTGAEPTGCLSLLELSLPCWRGLMQSQQVPVTYDNTRRKEPRGVPLGTRVAGTTARPNAPTHPAARKLRTLRTACAPAHPRRTAPYPIDR